jgi:hypothetical protein
VQFDDLRRAIRTNGLRGVCLDLWCRSSYKISKLLMMHVLVRAPIGVERLSVTMPAGFEHRFLDPAEIRQHAADPELGMTAAFLDEALAKGDRCHGILQDGRLVSYGWYAITPTRIVRDLFLSFSPGWLYAYKGFTLPGFRGMRLHDFALMIAPAMLSGGDLLSVVALVDANNFSSLRCMERAGYRIDGRICAAQLAGHWHVRLDERSRKLGLVVIVGEQA